MRYFLTVTALSLMASGVAWAGEEELYGTYSLVSTTFKLLETGQVETIPNEKGFITYTKEGRMFVVLVRGDRPKADSMAKMTDQQRADLFRSMTAYSGTYKFDGKTVEHNIEVSWNELWTGTKQVRRVRKEGHRVILTTLGTPRPSDGKLSETTLIWEKLD